MGRTKNSKPQKKKRRLLDDDNTTDIVKNEDKNFVFTSSSMQQQQQVAIDILLQTSEEDIEETAAEVLRSKSNSWYDIPINTSSSVINGLGTSKKINLTHFKVLQELHESIKEQTKTSWTSWSGSKTDPRKRAFGFLPNTLGYQESIRNKYLDITTPEWNSTTTTTTKVERNNNGTKTVEGSNTITNNNEQPQEKEAKTIVSDDNDNEERLRNTKAMILLKDNNNNNSIQEAIECLCDIFRPDVPSNLQSVLKYSNLIAVQPNLHGGRTLLPIHVDHPQKDGFGIIIITIAMIGSGTLLLQKSNKIVSNNVNDTHSMKMSVPEGYAYMLSDESRNAYAHGVLAKTTTTNATTIANRESLNLRFGLHDLVLSDETTSTNDLPQIPSQDVLQYW